MVVVVVEVLVIGVVELLGKKIGVVFVVQPLPRLQEQKSKKEEKIDANNIQIQHPLPSTPSSPLPPHSKSLFLSFFPPPLLLLGKDGEEREGGRRGKKIERGHPKWFRGGGG